jgi:predicted transcriptional regulator
MPKSEERKERKRRDRLYIMAELLKIAKDGSLKTHLMYGGNLSFAQLNDYLSFLISTGLLKTIQKGSRLVYKTTSKGLEFLTNYEKTISLLR